MASILKVDDLRGNTSAGDITITSEGGSATMQLQQGLVKAWAFVDGTGTVGLRDSFNATSVTDNSTGNYTVSWNNNMSTADYTASLTTSDSANGNDRWMTANYPHATGSLRGNSRNYQPTPRDSDGHSYIAIGDLA